MEEGLSIRTARRDEVEVAVDWAAAEGWNPGWNDADCFLAADPGGFLVGVVGDEPVAVISAVRYGEDFGFIGFYIVRPQDRGKGHGIAIWKAAMQRLEGRLVGLDGVVEQQDNYRKSGFQLAHRNVRHAGRAGGGGEPSTGGGGEPPAPGRCREGLVELGELPFGEVRDYDRAMFPADRRDFLECWIQQAGGRALGLLRNGRLCGYGVRRACRSGFKIGPLFADDEAAADALLDGLLEGMPAGETYFLDVPETNPAAVGLAQRRRMEVVFETARMYTGPAPRIPIERMFGVTSFELG